MKIDPQTVRDLELLDAPPGGTSVFGMLDHTRTAGGRARLRQRFQAPFTAADEIVATQRALAALAERGGVAAALPDGETMKEVERYLASSYLAPRNRLGAAWTWLRYPEAFTALERGVDRTLRFLRAMDAVAGALAGPLTPLLGALRDGVDTALEAVRRAIPVDAAGRERGATRMVRHDRALRERLRPEVLRLVEQAYELDALCSMAAGSRQLGMRFPRVLDADAPVVRIWGAVHPFVKAPVPNDVGLDGEAPVMFLTGPNMAGKTTCMKACALCVYLAQLGMAVPAREMELTPFERLFTAIGVSENVRLGYSYFFAEVRRVKEAAAHAARGVRMFAVFDEMFKGTNVKDAYEASRVVVLAFARCRTSLFLVSSHLVELAAELEGAPVRLRYFDAVLAGGAPSFDYRLKDGWSAQRLGMVLLEREGVLDLLGRIAPRPDGAP